MTNTTEDQDLQALAAQWQDQDVPEPALDVPALARRARLQKLGFVADLAIGAGGAVCGSYVMLAGDLLIGAAAVLFSLGAVAVVLKARMRADAADADPVDTRLQNLRDACDLQARSAQAGIYVVVMALLFLAVIVLAAAGSDRPAVSWTTGGALVFIAVGTLYTVRKLVRALVMRERLNGLLRERQTAVGDPAD